MKKKTPTALPAHPLVGKWFHSYEDERPTVIRWQGHILAEVAPGQFLVQLFDWMMGEPTTQKMVPVSAMARWDFYETHTDMNFAYETYARQRDREFEAQHPIDLNPKPPTSPDKPVH